MKGKERRDRIIQELKVATSPLSGTALAKKMGVSRQVIVQDMALLRVANKNIISTTRGYLLYEEDKNTLKRVFQVLHGSDGIRDELYAIVDNGGQLLDVTIYHEVYGMITVDLIIQNRRQADEFLKKLEEAHSLPLLKLTNGSHLHTVEAYEEETFERIEEELKKMGILVEEKND
jgi:hypothetical protein